MGLDLPREYLLLGLRLDRLVAGYADAYVGDPALRRAVAAEPLPVPAELAAHARLLAAELPASGLAADRVRFLDGQLRALAVGADRLAGRSLPYRAELAAYFQVATEPGDPAAYAAAHRELDRLLPGRGPLAARYAAYRDAGSCPRPRLKAAVEAVAEELRRATAAQVGLPEGESVHVELVSGRPWSGFTQYRGHFRSRVAVNADLPVRLAALPGLVAHEAYPGHHAERCHREAVLVDGAGRLEHAVFLLNTPECLVTEGLADVGLSVLVGEPGWGPWAEAVYAGLGLPFDGAHAEAVARAAAPLDRVRQDAALMLHDRHRPEEEVAAYLQRWLLIPRDRARRSLGFLTSPLWRAYMTTYVEGHRLVAAWLAGRPVGTSAAARFARLLDEPLTPAGLRAELAAALPVG